MIIYERRRCHHTLVCAWRRPRRLGHLLGRVRSEREEEGGEGEDGRLTEGGRPGRGIGGGSGGERKIYDLDLGERGMRRDKRRGTILCFERAYKYSLSLALLPPSCVLAVPRDGQRVGDDEQTQRQRAPVQVGA